MAMVFTWLKFCSEIRRWRQSTLRRSFCHHWFWFVIQMGGDLDDENGQCILTMSLYIIQKLSLTNRWRKTWRECHTQHIVQICRLTTSFCSIISKTNWLIRSLRCQRNCFVKWKWSFPRSQITWSHESFWPGKKDWENILRCEKTTLNQSDIVADLNFDSVNARWRFRLNIKHVVFWSFHDFMISWFHVFVSIW
jgi:hypothetical protein